MQKLGAACSKLIASLGGRGNESSDLFRVRWPKGAVFDSREEDEYPRGLAFGSVSEDPEGFRSFAIDDEQFVWLVKVNDAAMDPAVFTMDHDASGPPSRWGKLSELLRSVEPRRPPPKGFADEYFARNIGRRSPEKITELVVQLGPVADLSGIERLVKLKRFVICNQRVTDFSPLAGCPSLVEVWLQGNPARDLAPLAKLPKLAHLRIGNSRGLDVRSLTAAPALRELHIDGSTPKIDLRALRRIPTLRELWIGDDRVSLRR